MAREHALIALGANLDDSRGDRAAHLRAGLDGLSVLPDTRLLAASAVHETEPVGPPGQQRYLNAAARIETGLTPGDLLAGLLAIELSRGRVRSIEPRWGPRTLDLDLLLYGAAKIDRPGIRVPHPRLHLRMFVLEPAAEIAPDMAVPGLDATIGELRSRLLRSGQGDRPEERDRPEEQGRPDQRGRSWEDGPPAGDAH